MQDIDIPPITLQVTFDKMSPQIENLLYYVFILLITILLYIYLMIFDFIIKRIIFFRRNKLYYIEVDDEIN
jgi:hypothetical protein